MPAFPDRLALASSHRSLDVAHRVLGGRPALSRRPVPPGRQVLPAWRHPHRSTLTCSLSVYLEGGNARIRVISFHRRRLGCQAAAGPLGRLRAHRALPGPAEVLIRIAAADAGRANADGREEPAAGSPRTAVRPLTRRADRAARAAIVLGRGRAASGSAATPAPSRPSQNRPRRCVRVRSRRHQRNRIRVHRHPGLRAAGRRGGRPDRGHDPMFSDDSAFITGETGTADGASMQL